jgi:hypothetical protein
VGHYGYVANVSALHFPRLEQGSGGAVARASHQGTVSAPGAG